MDEKLNQGLLELESSLKNLNTAREIIEKGQGDVSDVIHSADNLIVEVKKSVSVIKEEFTNFQKEIVDLSKNEIKNITQGFDGHNKELKELKADIALSAKDEIKRMSDGFKDHKEDVQLLLSDYEHLAAKANDLIQEMEALIEKLDALNFNERIDQLDDVTQKILSSVRFNQQHITTSKEENISELKRFENDFKNLVSENTLLIDSTAKRNMMMNIGVAVMVIINIVLLFLIK